MFLEKLSLTNFKNHDDGRFAFGRQINVIVGPNGSGKTNLLDAVYFLSLTKSAFQSQDALNIEHEADYLIVDGIFTKPGETRSNDSTTDEPAHDRHTQITISVQRGQRKVVLADKKPYDRVSEHIGRFPVVLLAPNDTDLVREHSEDRRHFFDGVLSQIDPDYLRDYLQYQHLLKQRNSLLKHFADPGTRKIDYDLLDTYDGPLLELTARIHARRQRFIAEFLPIFTAHYRYLSEADRSPTDRSPASESVLIHYESEATNPEFAYDFLRNRPRDLAAQRTTLGVHRDDYGFEIGGVPLKKFGSQGQQKTFVIALKLAQFEQLTIEKGVKPILLLDDIFDKLDDQRIGKLIRLMDEDTFGQLFITDARPERTAELLASVRAEVRFFRIGG
jgi:DNA replication and repair protein RecF